MSHVSQQDTQPSSPTPEALPPETGIILVDHGSKREAANAMLDEVVRMYRTATGAPIVEPAHMELAEPTIEAAFARCVAQGARRVVVHPYFLAPGRHSTSDIPRMADEAAQAFPGVDYCVTEPLGLDERMMAVVQRRIHEALGSPVA